jgi:hypothetical protein
MSLFFPQEFCTYVVASDGYIVIEQYADSTSKQLLGFVRLTHHQFMEIWNREKHIKEMLSKDAEDRGIVPFEQIEETEE